MADLLSDCLLVGCSLSRVRDGLATPPHRYSKSDVPDIVKCTALCLLFTVIFCSAFLFLCVCVPLVGIYIIIIKIGLIIDELEVQGKGLAVVWDGHNRGRSYLPWNSFFNLTLYWCASVHFTS